MGGQGVSLPELLDMLRAKGVTHYSGTLSGSAVTVTFGAAEPQTTGKQRPFEMNGVEACPCGHAPYEHNGGLCLHGCEPTKCIPRGEKKS